MTAIQCARKGIDVLLLDGREKIGAKILMSGGTRCNVTNQQVDERDFAGDRPIAIRNVLRAYPADKAVAFFNEIGVDLISEEGGKYFPSTHSARTVLDALLAECKKGGVDLVTGRKITRVFSDGECFTLWAGEEEFTAKTAVLATGGLSYPTTGSDGSGYPVAEHFGHTLVPTVPALTPLKTEDAIWKKLSGVALPVRLTLRTGGKRIIQFEEPLLFTHFGFSGPAALNISRYWLRHAAQKNTEIIASFLPESSEEILALEIEEARKETPQASVRNFMAQKTPKRIAAFLLDLAEIPADRNFADLRREERHALMTHFFYCMLPVSDVMGYGKAEATAGGVRLAEIDTATMESKLEQGLFFAGEMLDADGHIGGFNFQWAWSSGTVAAGGIAKRLKLQV